MLEYTKQAHLVYVVPRRLYTRMPFANESYPRAVYADTEFSLCEGQKGRVEVANLEEAAPIAQGKAWERRMSLKDETSYRNLS